jgi:hypothetical protein
VCRHVDRQVNYKILWLKIPNNAKTLSNPPSFDRGSFEAILIENIHRTLGVKNRPLLVYVMVESINKANNDEKLHTTNFKILHYIIYTITFYSFH